MSQNSNKDDKPRAGNEKRHFLKAFLDEKTALDSKSWLIDKFIYEPVLRLLTKLNIPAPVARQLAVFLTLLLFVGLVYLALFVFISLIFLIF